MPADADVIIVGSGVGGATAAKELAAKGRKVLIVEKGPLVSLDRMGSEWRAFNCFDKYGLLSKTKEGVFYYRTIMAGGTSVVSCANGVRSLETEFKNMGMDLTEEFIETEKELAISPVPDDCLGAGTRAIMESAEKLGFPMEPMPKFINFENCTLCGNCVLGCRIDEKWTALQYLKEAQDNGASLVTETDAVKVLISNGKAIGIEAHNKNREKIEMFAHMVILAAGGLGSPIILLNSGIEAGTKLFLDLFNVTVGLTKDVGLTKEIPMAALHHDEGLVLSPFIDTPAAFASVMPEAHIFRVVRKKGILQIMQRKHILGIMTKIKDDSAGQVHKDGSIEKTLTPEDLAKLDKGADISKEILIGAGVDPETIATTKVRGAHPGGTAAIGEVVDVNFETKIKNLFVCDASVLPLSPGKPPIVTIVALAKRFAKKIAQGHH